MIMILGWGHRIGKGLQLGFRGPWFREERGHDQVFLVVTNVDVLAGSLCSLKIRILLHLRGTNAGAAGVTLLENSPHFFWSTAGLLLSVPSGVQPACSSPFLRGLP